MLSTVTLNNKDISVSVLKIKLLKHGMLNLQQDKQTYA